MKRAIELAERGRGHVEPNPLVGAVFVKDGAIVGEGWHERFGGPHAEINALRLAGIHARGADLYVTLEPCCHHGKTPPCTDALLAMNVARVFAAIEDPFPQVAGHGAKQLRAAGVSVEFGDGAAEVRRQNAPYLTLLTHGRPHVHGKWAMSLDGKIATRTGESKWISSKASRKVVHEMRGRMDGIVVGIGTALADDPLLTARPPGPRTPARVVLDARARLPISSQLVRTARETPTLVVVGEAADSAAHDALRNSGCKVLTVPTTPAGVPDVSTLMREFGRRRWTNVLVEGGAAVLGSFAEAGLLDELHVFIALKIIGGKEAPGPIGGEGIARIADAVRWAHSRSREIDGDLYLHAWK